MKKLIYLFAALSLLLAACEKDDAQPAEPPVPSYSLLSVERELIYRLLPLM